MDPNTEAHGDDDAADVWGVPRPAWGSSPISPAAHGAHRQAMTNWPPPPGEPSQPDAIGSVPAPPSPPSPPSPPASEEGWTEITVGGFVPSAATKHSRRRQLIAIGATVAVLTGALTSIRLLHASSAASSTPSAAVERFVDALERRDLLGAVDTFPKADRSLVAESITEITSDAPQPIKDIDLHALPGYTLTISGLQLSAEPVTDDIALVTLSAGHYRATADVREIARRLGMSNLLDSLEPEELSPEAEGDLGALDEPIQVATVRDDDGWHVSIPYTVAELARRDMELPAPDPAKRVPAVGAASPEAAARELADAIVAADWRHAIELLPNDDAAVAHDYGALFAEHAANDLKPWAKIDALETHTKQRGTRTAVVVDKLTLTWLATENDSGGTATIEHDGSGCLKLTSNSDGDTENLRACVDDLATMMRHQIGGSENAGKVLDVLREAFNDAGVVTVKRDGRWFVAPYHTAGSLGVVAYVGLISAFVGMDSGITDQTDAGFVAPQVPGSMSPETPDTSADEWSETSSETSPVTTGRS